MAKNREVRLERAELSTLDNSKSSQLSLPYWSGFSYKKTLWFLLVAEVGKWCQATWHETQRKNKGRFHVWEQGVCLWCSSLAEWLSCILHYNSHFLQITSVQQVSEFNILTFCHFVHLSHVVNFNNLTVNIYR